MKNLVFLCEIPGKADIIFSSITRGPYMLGFIPFLCLAAVILTLRRFLIRFGRQVDWRLTVLAGAALWVAFVYCLTETLSLFHAITFGAILIGWLGLFAVTAVTYFLLMRNPSDSEPTADEPDNKPKPKPHKKSAREANDKSAADKLTAFHYVLLAMAGMIVVAVFLVAIVSPPNNWDSMTYHLARVEHWIQNHSVDHYPTHIIRQLYLNPMAEYVILQLRILSDSDRLVNLVQFCAMLGSLVAVSLIAKLLGSRRNGQVYAVLLCACLPMGILQASSTQNDYVAAFWLASFAAVTLQLRQKSSLWMYALAGLTLGLGALTKMVCAVYAAPFAMWLAIDGIRRLRWRAVPAAAIVTVVCLALTLPYFVRNYHTFGSITRLDKGPKGEDLYANESHAPTLMMSNITRNVAIHLGTPWPGVNESIRDVVLSIHELMNADPNDPRTTFQNVGFDVAPTNYNEDTSGNTLHFLAGLAALGVILARKSLRTRYHVLIYAACLFISLVLFCGYLRWQPWHSRLHLGLFVLGVPLLAVALDSLPRMLVATPIIICLTLFSWPWITKNSFRPMAGQVNIFNMERTKLYFCSNPRMYTVSSNVCRLIEERRVHQLGLIFGADDWEYPLWVMLRDHVGPDVRIDHVRVENPSGKLWNGECSATATTPAPPAVLYLNGGNNGSLRFTQDGRWPIPPTR